MPPLHTALLIAWFALPVLVWGVLLCFRRRIHPVAICAICFFAMITGTFALAQHVWALDAHLLAEVDKYEPGTPEAQRASEEWANDVDRSLTLLLSPLMTGIMYTFLFALLFGVQWMVIRSIGAGGEPDPGLGDAEAIPHHGEGTNPYHPTTK